MHQPRLIVVGIGELLWDIFEDLKALGGAPANFACHAAALGANSYLVSSVGCDQLGEESLRMLKQKGVDTDLITHSNSLQTGKVFVDLGQNQHQPKYTIQENVAWDRLPWSESHAQLAAQCHAVCFGTLSQRNIESRKAINNFLNATGEDCLRVFDVNFRRKFYDRETVLRSLKLANAMKLNGQELQIVAGMTGLTIDCRSQAILQLAEKFELQLVALTLGAGGSCLCVDGKVIDIKSVRPTVLRSTVGAGDAYLAAVTVGYLHGYAPEIIGRLASQIAAFVCTRKSATPLLPKELQMLFR
ncbi:MAG: carbohydrate kinase [Planctomycetota bacterium]